MFTSTVFGLKLKRLLILDFVNIEKEANYDYIALSMTNTTRDYLKKKFAFKEVAKEVWQAVAKKNFIYTDEYFTKTAAMNLGLLSKHDIVISAGYIIKKKSKDDLSIITNVRIFDISKKKILTSFKIVGPADMRIFDTINEIATKITQEAKSILPSKSEWEKTGIVEEEPGLPIFDNFLLGLRVGGSFYYQGWADHFSSELPSLGLVFRANTPAVWRLLAVQFEATYLKHTLKSGQDTRVQSLDLNGTTFNYFVGLYAAFDLSISSDFTIIPKIGGGYTMQITTVTGKAEANFSNGFPFIGAGVEFSYLVNKSIRAILVAQNMTEVEKGVLTYVNYIGLGINLGY